MSFIGPPGRDAWPRLQGVREPFRNGLDLWFDGLSERPRRPGRRDASRVDPWRATGLRIIHPATPRTRRHGLEGLEPLERFAATAADIDLATGRRAEAVRAGRLSRGAA